MSPSGNRKTRGVARQGGFTALELLVAIAIFVTLMAGVVSMFTGIIRTVQGSHATMDAMENIRASMAVFESDVKRAFASLEQEDARSFYGEPTGFAYVGVDRNGKPSRVTYTLHVDPEQTEQDRLVTLEVPLSQVVDAVVHYLMIDRDGDGYTDYQFQGIPDQPLPVDWANEVTLSAAEGALRDPVAVKLATEVLPIVGAPPQNPQAIPAESRNILVSISFDGRRGLLLRYEEPGKTSLEDLDIPLTSELPITQYLDYATNPQNVPRPLPADAKDPLVTATRGALWLQRARGIFDVPFLLPAIPKNASGEPPFPLFWREDNGTSGRTLKDHLVIDNILLTAWLCEPGTLNWIMGQDFSGTPVPVPALDLGSFFYYGDEYDVSAPCFNALWNVPFLSRGLDQRFATADNPKFSWLAWQLIASNDFQGNLIYPGILLASRYWLFRFPPENWNTLTPPLHPVMTSTSPGNPLESRLPAWISMGFWFVADAPGPQGQTFCKWVSQRIELPTGYMRGSF